MAHNYPDSDRIEAARRLYLKYKGKNHELIEKEMRELGYHDFHRRILYPRFERQKHRPGWIERYGFETNQLRNAKCGMRIQDETENSECRQIGETHGGMNKHSEFPHSALRTPHSEEVSPTGFDHFQAWLKDVSPEMTWTWKHQVHIYKRLKRVSDGICKRLMIFLPPRHGKSELVTVRYTAWRMKKDPKMNVILGSYNQRLANRFSRKIKKVLMDDFALTAGNAGDLACNENEVRTRHHFSRNPRSIGTPSASDARNAGEGACVPAGQVNENASPFPFVSNRLKNTESEWETAVGGGLRAVGVGSGVTGFGANLIVIDDPVKSRAEAESAKMREKVWHWFNDDIYTRLEPGGSIVLIQTRWHEDDLAGRLLREPVPEGGEKWEVVNLPALAEAAQDNETRSTGDNEQENAASATLSPCLPSPCLDDRLPGEALCPSRFNEAYFQHLREKIGSYSFASLYQQRPVPAEGGMFRRKWFEQNIIAAAPAGLRWKRGTDPGVSAGEKADFSASVRVAIDRSGNMYIADMFRRQVEYPELRRFIVDCLKNERQTEHAIELAGHGNAIHQDLLKNGDAQGRAFRGIKATDPKMARALPWLALAEAGKVFLIRGPWNEEFINETASFPMGTHDDQIDAVSIAFELATAKSKKSYGF